MITVYVFILMFYLAWILMLYFPFCFVTRMFGRLVRDYGLWWGGPCVFPLHLCKTIQLAAVEMELTFQSTPLSGMYI